MAADNESTQSDRASSLSSTRSVLSSMEEVRSQMVAVIRQAERHLAIYTKTLESPIYEHPSFVEALKRLTLTRPFTRVRILVAEQDALHQKHPLVVMAARLSSIIEIREMPVKLYDASVFMVADERAVVYRIHCTRWDGIADMQDQPVAKMYLAKFDRTWTEGLPLAAGLSVSGLKAR